MFRPLRSSLQSVLLVALVVCSVGFTINVTGAKSSSGGSGTFALTGSMNLVRFNHQAVLLKNGQVLVVGGVVGNINNNAAELYNPATGKWTLSGSTAILHGSGALSLLPNGEVLLAGGSDVSSSCTATAELYNPLTGRWTTTSSMDFARCASAATLLPNGQVLVAGGFSATGAAVSTAELYNPSTGTWQSTGSINTTTIMVGMAELLGNGTALVVGRDSTAWLFSPTQRHWSQTGSLTGTGHGPLSLLANGDVLVVNNSFFNPATGTWTPTGPIPRFVLTETTATLLGTGNVLITGMRDTYTPHPPLPYALLYNFASNSYTFTGNMNVSRAENTATLLPNGKVLITGGYNVQTDLSSAELYTP